MKTRLMVGLAVAIGCSVGGVLVVRRQAAPPAVRQTVSTKPTIAPAPVESPSTPEPLTPEPRPASSDKPPQTRSVKSGGQSEIRKQAVEVAPQVDQQPNLTDISVPEPLARAALSFVGTDPDAEGIWVMAINDPSLSPDARQNLIEDLNEDGFPDPENPTRFDLPLIVSRIEIIEQLGPDAMDDVNAAAFEEAYKDLTDMYARVTGM